MAQISILSMLKKSNDRLGRPVQDENMLGELVRNDTICWPDKPADTLSKSRSSEQKSQSSEPTDDLLVLSSHAKGVNPQKTRKRKSSLESSSEPVKKVTKVDASKTWQDKWLVEFKWLKYENGAMYLCILHKNESKFSQNG